MVNIARMLRNAYNIFIGKPEWKRLKWGSDDNIKIYLRDLTGRYGLNSCDSGYLQVKGSCEHGNFVTRLAEGQLAFQE